MGCLKRLLPMMSSRNSSMPSSCSVRALGFIMAICSTSPWNKPLPTPACSLVTGWFLFWGGEGGHPEGACYAYARYVWVLLLCSVTLIIKKAATKYACCGKTFVVTKLCLLQQTHVCRDKSKIVVTKMILVAALTNDTGCFTTHTQTIDMTVQRQCLQLHWKHLPWMQGSTIKYSLQKLVPRPPCNKLVNKWNDKMLTLAQVQTPHK